MDLLCCEQASPVERVAYDDPTLLQDRVLFNLLRQEDNYSPACTSFPAVQDEVTPEMRKIVAEWMMEVCEEQKCQDEVLLLSTIYMDRFLDSCRIHKNQLQLLGTACMLIASKLREPKPLSAEMLVFYTDHSISLEDLWSWELLVLSKLKWDIALITPKDFLRHILGRLPVEAVGIEYNMVHNHAKTLMALCAREFKFSRYNPSVIASASIVSALCGVGWARKSGKSIHDLLQAIHEITSIEKDFVLECFIQIDNMLKASSGINCTDTSTRDVERTPRIDEFTPPPSSGKLQELETAVTPTDVHDVQF